MEIMVDEVWASDGAGEIKPQQTTLGELREDSIDVYAKAEIRKAALMEAAEVCEKYSHSLSSRAKKDILALAKGEK